MTYKEYNEIKQKEANELPLFFAFNNEQIYENLKKYDYEIKDIISLGFAGGYFHKKDLEIIKVYFSKKSDLKEYLKDKEFFKEALDYELSNHEFGYTYDLTDTFKVLGITKAFIKKNGLTEIFEEVISKY